MRAIELHHPWAVINAASYSLIDEAEINRDRCVGVNVLGALNGAHACAKAGIRYVMISSDLVFDGLKPSPYLESDETGPLNVYGESKERAEKSLLGEFPGSLVIRTSPVFDRWSECDFTAHVLKCSGMPLVLPQGRISPTYVLDLCHGLLDLVIDEEAGIWHLANQGNVSWLEFAELLAARFRVPPPCYAEKGTLAARPVQSVLASEKASFMPCLENALSRFYDDYHPLLRSADHRSVGAR